MRKSMLLGRVLIGCALAFASVAQAMPSESDIKKAKPIVESLIADDIAALKRKEKRPEEVAATQCELAKKAESEAGKFLLLQSVFSIYASNGLYDEACGALENLNAEIPDVPPEEIVKMVDGSMSRADPEKASKVLSMYRAAKRKVECRRRLALARTELKKNPSDKAVIRAIGDSHVGLGDWPKALKAYARLGFAAAKYEIAPGSTADYDILKTADFWWNYKTADDEPFKAHAAELYSAAVEKGLATGLRREMALKRIEDAKQLGALRAQARQAPSSSMNDRSGSKETIARTARKTKSDALDVKFKTGLVGYWPFDGNANDSSGMRNNGKPIGITPTEDRFGEANKAYRFNGNGYVEVPDTLSLRNITGAFTMAAWINPRSWYDGWMPIMQKGDKRNVQYQLTISPDGIGKDSKGQICVEFGKWQHIALTCDGSQRILYLNGQTIHTFRPVGHWRQNSHSLFIGYDPWGLAEYYIGDMDDFRLYNRALTEQEMKELYKAEAPEN